MGASLAACVALVVIQVVAAAFPSLSVRGLRAFATDAGGRGKKVGRRPALEAQTGPPVEYVRAEGARHTPAGMHVEYVPGVCPAD